MTEASTAVPAAGAFLRLAQDGDRRGAARMADAAIRDGADDERTLAYATLTYLHCGRFRAATRTLDRLAGARGSDAQWARAAVAVALRPEDGPAALAELAVHSATTAEYALLAGVAWYQQGDRENGDRWLAGADVDPRSVFTTAAALGMRRRANAGPAAIAVQVTLVLAGFAVLGLIGLALGSAGAAAVNRRRMRGTVAGPANALLAISTPREQHGRREVARFVALVMVVVAVVVALIALAALTA